MWLWRCMERVRWTGGMTNAEVLAIAKETPGLMEMRRREKHQQIGHVVRHESLLQTNLEGRMEEMRPKGWKRIRMVDDIINGSTYTEMKSRVENREESRHEEPTFSSRDR